ncbi:uncharacterized protein LOC125761385 isoform X2 [Anopheles funestus]|uniref:uncharacterized protein LOC125761385 isoform X2 n=1 Tax=Anopheles funestus TaxID=62324 RepID=UPI0020C664F5|nr:uncharacterized protein LOC125761385 isoform X2 [Anopheles funestus]
MESLRMPRNPSIREQKTILLFINQIKLHPCLWDQADANNRNAHARQDAWCAIARKVGYSVTELRRKWRSLTCHYFKLKDDLELRKKTQSKDWFAYCPMEFLGNSKNVRNRRGKHTKYIILGEERSIASDECDLKEIVHLEDDVEEIEENYEATMENNLSEATSECTVSYDIINGKLEEDTTATLYHEHNNADDSLTDSEVSFQQLYMNEKRKSALLYELNEKLEKEIQQQRAEMQLQQLKLSSLEQKLKHSERKLAKFLKVSQNDDTMVQEEEYDTKETLIDGTTVTKTKITTIQSLSTDEVADQCDPLRNRTGITNHDSNPEAFQLMASSIKKMQNVIENFANQSKRRYSGFGDFMVRELNEMDEITSIRLINEITSMLKNEGNMHRNTRGHGK